jgi:hypothetical protein
MSFVQSRFRITNLRFEENFRRTSQILTLYGRALDKQLKEEIKLVQFPWPGTTYRRNGTIEGSPRDIVDTGAFLRSQNRQRVNQNTIRFTWGGSGGVTYAGNIFQGIYRGGQDASRVRDWIKPALDALPIGEFFAREWRRLQNTRGL